MSRKTPKLKENSRGELVTQGRWITAAELERQGKTIANRFYNLGGRANYEQLTAMQAPVEPLMAAINGTIAISQCDNGLKTRNFARATLEGMKAHLKRYTDLWDNRAQYPDIEIDRDKFQELTEWTETIISLLEAYTAAETEGDSRTNEHAELREYLVSINPALDLFSVERLGLKQREKDTITQAAVKRVDELMLSGKSNVSNARRQAAEEMNLSYDAVKKAHQRYRESGDT
jgi:hypothetical protein